MTSKEYLYNIHNLLLQISFAVLFLVTNDSTFAQVAQKNKYGLEIIETAAALQQSATADSNMAMLDIKELVPGIIIDLKYSTKDNFLHTALYPAGTPTTYLRRPAALALQKVQALLNSKGLSLKIWDAYRPYSVTEKMWEPVKDDRYAADPKFGSGHNRGIAVDLTIVDKATGKELDMGTGFDNFSDTAHSNYTRLPQAVLQNRQLLRAAMEQHGFKVLDTEWWHFYLPDSKKYALMNLSFKQLDKWYKRNKKKK
ncbi:MAG: M15 family metallopeptidase [Ferruginibacter sp.]